MGGRFGFDIGDILTNHQHRGKIGERYGQSGCGRISIAVSHGVAEQLLAIRINGARDRRCVAVIARRKIKRQDAAQIGRDFDDRAVIRNDGATDR